MAGEKNNPFFLLIINYIQPGEKESSFCANGSLNYAFATIYDCFCQLLESQYGSGFFFSWANMYIVVQNTGLFQSLRRFGEQSYY